MKGSRRAVAALFALTCSAPSARADVPPPDGSRYVGYSFTVTGLAAAGDRVLFAYPCGSSNGAPVAEYRKVEEGRAVSVGRRGGGCTIYATSKASFDAFAATYRPANGVQDPALDALAKGAVKCSGGPSPSFRLPTSDSRSSIEETFAVRAVTDAECVLASTTPTTANATATATKAPSGKSCAVGRAPGAGPGASSVATALALAGLGRRRARRARLGDGAGRLGSGAGPSA
jgi:hypothetical protein